MDYPLKKLKDDNLLVNDLKLFSICKEQKKLNNFMIDLTDRYKTLRW